MEKIALFLNGLAPKVLPNLKQFDQVYCTDGAYNYLKKMNIKPDVVIGDFDSYSKGEIPIEIEVIETPDQDFTDFEKALQIIQKRGYKTISVYGSSGMEHDHFLGNLTAGLKFKEVLNITFYDDYSQYFFAPNELIIDDCLNKIISLYPFPQAKSIITNGLKYPLNCEDLDLSSRIGIRNIATEKQVKIKFSEGNLLVFIQK